MFLFCKKPVTKKLFKEYKLEVEFNVLKKRRNDIFHGYKKLDIKFVEEVNKYIPALRKALIITVSILLDFDPHLLLDELEDGKGCKRTGCFVRQARKVQVNEPR